MTRWSKIDRRILEISLNDNNGAFPETIAKIAVQLGCALPSDEGYFILLEFYKKHYSDLTYPEILYAFELHLIAELPDAKGDSAIHYNNFDCRFFGEVLTRYKKKREAIIVKARSEMPRIEPPKISDQEATRRILKHILDDFDKPEPELGQAKKYEILDELHLIKVTKEQGDEYLKKAAKKIKFDAAVRGDLKELREISKGIDDKSLLATAKRLAYLDFLNVPENKELVKHELQSVNEVTQGE